MPVAATPKCLIEYCREKGDAFPASKYGPPSVVVGQRVAFLLPCAIVPQEAFVDSGKAVHFFPFEGDFNVSVGKDVWRKSHRSPSDDLLKQATDDWPMLYENEWSSKIANFLPTDNALDVIPFLELNASRDSVRAHIMTLTSASTVHVLSGDDINNGGTFAIRNYNGDTQEKAPR